MIITINTESKRVEVSNTDLTIKTLERIKCAIGELIDATDDLNIYSVFVTSEEKKNCCKSK